MQSTFTTIHLNDNYIYYKEFQFNEITNSLFEITKNIDFSVEEYRNKYHNPNDSQTLREFRISNTLPEILESKVKFYHQINGYNSYNYSAIFVMNDNKVYGIGYNEGGILGLGHNRKVEEFTLIEELCDQNIEEFFEYYSILKRMLYLREIMKTKYSVGVIMALDRLARGYESYEQLETNENRVF